jgi:hypothetical protein
MNGAPTSEKWITAGLLRFLLLRKLKPGLPSAFATVLHRLHRRTHDFKRYDLSKPLLSLEQIL